jgi:hypothetical protein
LGISASALQIEHLDALIASLEPIRDDIRIALDLVALGGPADAYLAKFQRLTRSLRVDAVRMRDDGHLGESRNWIIEQARAPLLWFVDGDDTIDGQKMSWILKQLRQDETLPALTLFGGRAFSQTSSESWCAGLLPPDDFSSADAFRTWFANGGWRITSACLKLHSTDWLRSNRAAFPVGVLYEDTPFWFQLASAVADDTRIRIFNVEAYNYRRWGNQISTRRDIGLFDIFSVIATLEEQNRNAPALLQIAFHSFVLDHLLWSSRMVADSPLPSAQKETFRLQAGDCAAKSRDYLRGIGRYHLNADDENQLFGAPEPHPKPEGAIARVLGFRRNLLGRD